MKNNIKVLMYHRVLEEKPIWNSKWHYVTADMFERQMQWLDRLGYKTITFADYDLFLKGRLTLPKKSIIITFDDGYLDTYTVAIPIMKKYNMRAVIFVLGNRKLVRAEWDEVSGEAPCILMNDDQLRVADAMGFEIGAHSMNHLDLVSISDSEMAREIGRSKDQIEQILGKPIHAFAYPYGRVDERVSEAVMEWGFDFACGVYTGPPEFSKNTFDIRRLAIHTDISILNFLLRIITPYQYLHWTYSKVRSKTHKISKSYSSRKVEQVSVEHPVN